MGMLDFLHHVFIEQPEKSEGNHFRVYPFMGPGYHFVLLTLAYTLFVFKIGPRFMKNRPPFDLKRVLFFYNSAQIILNAIIFIVAVLLIHDNKTSYNLGCMTHLPADHPQRNLEFWLSYGYFLLKLLDYMDTVFFVLRKSFKQVTFLHVYHHILMAGCLYVHMRWWGIGGHLSLMGVMNCLVHVIMYGYYFVSAQYPGLRESLWWKKYITILQLVQFVLIFLHNCYPLLFRPDCTYSKFWLGMGITQSVVMMYLFGNFYRKAYLQPAEKRTKAAVGDKKAT